MVTERKVVAIVDDHPVMRQAVKSLLSAFGYGTETYESGEEFLAQARTTKARCLLTDIQLGGMSGISLAQRLAASGFKLPTIFMTGSEDERLRRDALKSGGVAFLRKPFPAAALIDAIAKAITACEEHGDRRASDGCHTSP